MPPRKRKASPVSEPDSDLDSNDPVKLRQAMNRLRQHAMNAEQLTRDVNYWKTRCQKAERFEKYWKGKSDEFTNQNSELRAQANERRLRDKLDGACDSCREIEESGNTVEQLFALRDQLGRMVDLILEPCFREGETCPLCMDKILDPEGAVVLECEHMFHLGSSSTSHKHKKKKKKPLPIGLPPMLGGTSTNAPPPEPSSSSPHKASTSQIQLEEDDFEGIPDECEGLLAWEGSYCPTCRLEYSRDFLLSLPSSGAKTEETRWSSLEREAHDALKVLPDREEVEGVGEEAMEDVNEYALHRGRGRRRGLLPRDHEETVVPEPPSPTGGRRLAALYEQMDRVSSSSSDNDVGPPRTSTRMKRKVSTTSASQTQGSEGSDGGGGGEEDDFIDDGLVIEEKVASDDEVSLLSHVSDDDDAPVVEEGSSPKRLRRGKKPVSASEDEAPTKRQAGKGKGRAIDTSSEEDVQIVTPPSSRTRQATRNRGGPSSSVTSKKNSAQKRVISSEDEDEDLQPRSSTGKKKARKGIVVVSDESEEESR